MKTITDMLPPSGALIRLDRAPIGSWARAGEVYRVSYQGTQRRDRLTGKRSKVIHAQTSVRLWNEAAECGTFDSAMMWMQPGREALWCEVAS